jgi:hypothetical protein
LFSQHVIYYYLFNQIQRLFLRFYVLSSCLAIIQNQLNHVLLIQNYAHYFRFQLISLYLLKYVPENFVKQRNICSNYFYNLSDYILSHNLVTYWKKKLIFWLIISEWNVKNTFYGTQTNCKFIQFIDYIFFKF